MDFLRRRRISNESEDELIVSSRNKSRKPPNTAFRQQRLKAWQPILTPKTVLPLLIVLMVIVIPLGILLVYATYNVEQLTIEYSKCNSVLSTSGFKKIPGKHVSYHYKKSTSTYDDYAEPRWKLEKGKDDDGDTTEKCIIEFDLPNEIKPPIYVYYKLTNFYQNHREYVESYDLDQLAGKAIDLEDLDDNCKPLRIDPNGKAYYPCGLVANSVFNDTINSLTLLNPSDGNSNETYELSDKKIAWSSDRSNFKKTKYNVKDIVPPPNWRKKYPKGYTKDNLPDISKDEFFQNWMRTALLPSFMKLAAKNTTSTLKTGTYQLELELNYPVSIFGGTKSIVITSNSVVGGRNMSLGICYLVVGGLCLTFFLVFLLKQLINPRKVGSLSRNSVKFGDNEFHVNNDDQDRNLL